MKDHEAVYDEKISPLMTEIIRVCKEHKIQMLASFLLRVDEDGPFLCTTYLEDKGEPHSEELLEARMLLKPPKPAFTAIAITTATAR